MEKKFTTIRTRRGQFDVFKDNEKYFLEYLEDKGNQSEKVGYLVKENGQFYLQEAFFDKLNYEHVLFRSVVKTDDPIIRKDLFDNLIAACYQIEKTINNNGNGCNGQRKSATYMTGSTKRKWTHIMHALQKGSDLETAVHALRDEGVDND